MHKRWDERNLRVGFDEAFENRWTTFTIYAWCVIAALILAGLAGLFGNGALARATASADGGALLVKYDRFARYKTPSELAVQFSHAAGDGHTAITIDRGFVEGAGVSRANPQSELVTLLPDAYRYEFRNLSGASGVSFALQPKTIGPISGRIALSSGQAVAFTQYVYP